MAGVGLRELLATARDAADSTIVEFEGMQDQCFIETAISYKVF